MTASGLGLCVKVKAGEMGSMDLMEGAPSLVFDWLLLVNCPHVRII